MDITFENVSYIYQPGSPFAHQALTDLSFYIPSGSFVAIVGHTGSGKSTLIQHLNGLVRPTKGTVSIGDYHLSRDKKPKQMKDLRSKVGIVFQYPEHQLFEESVEKDISFGPRNFGASVEAINQRVKKILPAVGISESLLERSPFELSGGQMRRVAIAGVLAIGPEVLVLDEPTAGLDPRGQSEIMDMFYQMHKQEDLTTILVTHRMEDAVTYADHVIILNDGMKYMEGKPEDVLTEREALNRVQLDVPDAVRFLNRFEDRFKVSIPFHRQTTKEIAQEVGRYLKGGQMP